MCDKQLILKVRPCEQAVLSDSCVMMCFSEISETQRLHNRDLTMTQVLSSAFSVASQTCSNAMSCSIATEPAELHIRQRITKSRQRDIAEAIRDADEWGEFGCCMLHVCLCVGL